MGAGRFAEGFKVQAGNEIRLSSDWSFEDASLYSASEGLGSALWGNSILSSSGRPLNPLTREEVRISFRD